MEEHGILATTKIKNSYRGSIDKIIQKIAVGYLNKKLTFLIWRCNYHTKWNKVITPNLNPNKPIKGMSRATTKTISPYLFGQLYMIYFRFGNLDTMYSQDPWNEKLPYTFNPSNLILKLSELEKSLIINGLFPNSSQFIKLYCRGTLRCKPRNY